MARAVKRRSSPSRVLKPAEHAAVRPQQEPGSTKGRVPAIDALRAAALLMMFAYHFAFDLRYYGVLRADFEHDAFWISFRSFIVATFMILVGISIVLADAQGTKLPRFLRRVGVIATGALAATVASWLVFPASFIYFGILHCIAVTSLIAWPLRRAPWFALVIGIIVLATGLAFRSTAFDATYLSWIGFVTRKPFTEDYVPLAPWAAAAFVGIAVGHALKRTDFRAVAGLNGAPRWLQWMGRHSLLIYLLHQPLFMGVLWLVFRR